MTQHIKGVNGPLLGKFRVAAVSGLVSGFVANTIVFAARFAPTSNVRAVLAGLRLKSQIVTPFTAANEFNLNAYMARAYTASPTGGSSVLPTGLNNVLHSAADGGITPITNWTAMMVCGLYGLNGGACTTDTNPFLVLPAAQISGSPSQQSYNETMLEPSSDQRYAHNWQGQTNGVAANAEGLIVTTPVTMGPGGVVRFVIEFEWYEYLSAGSAEVVD